jgi:hypothetical protein
VRAALNASGFALSQMDYLQRNVGLTERGTAARVAEVPAEVERALMGARRSLEKQESTYPCARR